MVKSDFKNLITDLGNVCKSVKPGELMKNHTTFKIGGPCVALAEPENSDELKDVIEVCEKHNVPYFVLGRGSNLLVSDNGYEGVMIKPGKSFQEISFDEDTMTVTAGCGVTLAALAAFACERGITGFEFASGIPGTVGGAVYMNAGAYGGEICQVCTSVDVMLPDGQIKTYAGDEMNFSYRHSRMEDEQGIVLSAVFSLERKPEEEIRAKMQDLMSRRRTSQPLDIPSAGSTFKRPVGGYAAALIDQSGLKGFQIGGAAVSQKHAGFVVNLGGATAADVRALMDAVSKKVYNDSGIRLEPEVRLW